MKKKEYTTVQIAVLLLKTEDIITISGGIPFYGEDDPLAPNDDILTPTP